MASRLSICDLVIPIGGVVVRITGLFGSAGGVDLLANNRVKKFIETSVGVAAY
jgi:hypothetical protein